jgi:hypothetical protein
MCTPGYEKHVRCHPNHPVRVPFHTESPCLSDGTTAADATHRSCISALLLQTVSCALVSTARATRQLHLTSACLNREQQVLYSWGCSSASACMHACMHACAHADAGARPECRSSASVVGARPRKAVKTVRGCAPPPSASTVSRKRRPISATAPSSSSPASSNAPNASADSTSAHL